MSQRRAGRYAAAMVIGLLVGCGGGGDAVEGPGADTGGDETTTEAGVAGITVTPTSGLTTSEKGGTATFTVVLTAAPSADVTIGISSSNEKEGTVSPKSLVFTAANWNAPQTVTVTGVDDADADGAQTYKIVTAPATSSDAAYNGKDADDVEVKNTDDESAGITVTPTSGLTTTEAGGTATFTIVLNTKPTANVDIPISTSNDKEGKPVQTHVRFTPLDWDAPRKITVVGVDDEVADGPQAYEIVTGKATSADKGYDGVDADNVKLTNVDDETPGVTVTPLSGLKTTEAGGTATFAIVLNSKPSADVTIPLSSDNVKEGTVSPASVKFTPLNWDAPQLVTVTGVDDTAADGNQPYKIVTGAATSADTGYSGLNAEDVSVTNVDNESAGITVTPTEGLTVTESGGKATFTVVLNSQPTGDVTIPLSSSDTAEGTVSPASLKFTTLNWNAPQTVTVTGVDDLVADGSRVFKILTGAATSADTKYAAMNADDVTVTNTDNDSPGLTVAPLKGNFTMENGKVSAEISIVLNSKPSANVTVPISVSNDKEGKTSVSSLTFTPLNWNAPQIVTVNGVNDDVADGGQVYFLRTGAATSADPGYSGLDGDDAQIINVDDDSAGILVIAAKDLETDEAGATAQFFVVLNSQPTAPVTIPVRSSNTKEGTVSPATLTFTPENWNAQQKVTVTGANDFIADGAQPYTVFLDPATSTDGNYAGIDAIDVSLTNRDNDSAGIRVSKISGDTNEGLGTATFTIELTSEPLADVTIDFTSSRPEEGTVPASLTIAKTAWASVHTITVKGVNDDVADGRQPYSIITSNAKSTDPTYNDMPVSDVDVFNVDNDSAGIRVTYVGDNLAVDEGGKTAKFSVRLESKPLANVTVPLRTSDATEGTISATSLVFTPDNWNAEQEITVTGVNDFVADGEQDFSIITDPATTTDTTGYSALDARNVPVKNADNDTAGVTVTTISGPTKESGGTSTFKIKLNSEPTADVTISFATDDATEGDVSPASVTFTASDYGDKVISVSGKNDFVADGNIKYHIVTSNAVSTDSKYAGMVVDDVEVINEDDDAKGFVVSALSTPGYTTEGGGTVTFTVALQSEPTAAVHLPIKSLNTAEGIILGGATELVWTPGEWKTVHTVTVKGVDDFVQDGNPDYTIELGSATGGDYAGIDPTDLTLKNNDDDTAGIVVSPVTGLVTSEAKTTASFTITLNSKPTADVTIDIASSDTTEGTVSVAKLVFSPSDWTTSKTVSKTVTITGVDDSDVDGDVSYTILTGGAVSADATYNGRVVDDVTATNKDNDVLSKLVFVSSQLYDGNLGGLAGADAKCQSLATAAGKTGTFKAWLSDSTANAADRLTHSTAPYVRTDGAVVANNWSDLVDGSLANPITVTESGVVAGAVTWWHNCCGGPHTHDHAVVYTATSVTGTRIGNTCGDWSSTSGVTTMGLSDVSYSAWTRWIDNELFCYSKARIYCIQQ